MRNDFSYIDDPVPALVVPWALHTQSHAMRNNFSFIDDPVSTLSSSYIGAHSRGYNTFPATLTTLYQHWLVHVPWVLLYTVECHDIPSYIDDPVPTLVSALVLLYTVACYDISSYIDDPVPTMGGSGKEMVV